MHIYVIDSGVRTTHSEFVGRIGISKSFVPGEPPEQQQRKATTAWPPNITHRQTTNINNNTNTSDAIMHNQNENKHT